MYRSWFAQKKMMRARRARKGDSDYLHAQLILAGQTVTRDVIAGTSHSYYFDCGCVRVFHLNNPLKERESLAPCKQHEALVAPRRPPRA